MVRITQAIERLILKILLRLLKSIFLRRGCRVTQEGVMKTLFMCTAMKLQTILWNSYEVYRI